MTDQTTIVEPKFYQQTWDLSYMHALGPTTSRFLEGLKSGQVLGRTTVEGRVIVPPRSYDDRTHTETGAWVEVGNEGIVEMFTIVYDKFRGLPDPPYAMAYVLLEGADTALVGMVRNFDMSDPAKAAAALKEARVVVTYAPEGERAGTAADYWFELA